MKKKGYVLSVIGGQFGSEGKGVICNHLAPMFDYAVRVGGPQAGHSFFHGSQVWKMRQLPCAWTNPGCILVIGAGAVVDLDVLGKEIALTKTNPQRVLIDPAAVVVLPSHRDRETSSDLKARIGSTLEGVGEARLARMNRDPAKCVRIADLNVLQLGAFNLDPGNVVSTVEVLHNALLTGARVMLEGTQGSGLSLIHGKWPYVTSHDTGAAQLAADCGIPPKWVDDVLLVARTMPIRVGGNSGPLRQELTWEQVSKRTGRDTKEWTTVTGRTRRIGEWDEFLFRRAIQLNAPTAIAMMFMDYRYPACEGVKDPGQLPPAAVDWIESLYTMYRSPVALLGTGGPQFAVVDTFPNQGWLASRLNAHLMRQKQEWPNA